MRKKIVSIIIASVIAAVCSGCDKSELEGANYSFDCALAGNPESLDPQFASDINSMTVIENMFTGLMKVNEKGALEKAVAKDYEISQDGLEYNFTLKKNCYWFFDADQDEEPDDNEVTVVTAHDFEFAFKRLFDPRTCSPHREMYKCLKNAESIISGSADYTELGVRAVSDNELTFELEYPSAGFLSSLALTPAMPCNERFFNDSKGRYGLDDKSIASNGAFFVRQWFYDPYGKDNFIYMGRNSKNNDFDRTYPLALNFYIKESEEEASKSFDEGVSDVMTTFVYNPKKFEGKNFKSYFNYTFGIIINPKNEQYSNTNIRKAFAYSIDKESFEKKLPDDMLAAYGMIPPGISFLNKGYREINADKASAVSSSDRELIAYDPDKAIEFYESGMEQMGLKSLENIKLLIPENLMDTEYIHTVTQNWQTLFSLYIGIEEVPLDDYNSRISSDDYTMAIYPLSGDRNDPVSVLEQFEAKNNEFGYANSTLQGVINDIKKLGSYNDGVELYSKAENIIINDFAFIPVFYKKEFFVMDAGDHDIIYDPFTKQFNFRYAKYYE